MMKRIRFIALIKAIDVTKFILNLLLSAVANQTMNVMQKSPHSYDLSFLFDSPCLLDDTTSEENTRDSLKTWECRKDIYDC